MAVFTKQIKIQLSDEQYSRLQNIANERKESMSSVVRQALDSINNPIHKKDDVADKPKKELSDYEFYGMWKDRTDMKDGAKWLRKQRKSAEYSFRQGLKEAMSGQTMPISELWDDIDM
jgi:hypothetical protein